jgi:glycosyltransferase involved in cell wall biosynthesis
MKVLYDYQAFDQKIGGVSRYFAEIVSRVSREAEARVALKYSANEYIKSTPGVKPPRFQASHGFRRAFRKYYTMRNRIASLAALREGACDVFHPTYYHDYFLGALGRIPLVLTIFDMTYEIYPELQAQDRSVSATKARLAKRADRIIAISARTGQDVIDLYGIPGEKISVIHLACQLPAGREPFQGLPESYLLFVGAREGYKNFLFFAQALAPVFLRHGDLRVVCTGQPFTGEEIAFLEENGIRDRFRAVFVPDEMMESVYRRARCLVFPSYYEGFGIPILEAFSSGCPVLLSDGSCFPEIARDAALYFQPKNAADLRRQMLAILENPKTADSLRERGFARAAEFSWDRAARETLAVYREVRGRS